MSLFKKPNRKFRQRETNTDSEDESGNNETTANKLKVQITDVKPTCPSESQRAEKEGKPRKLLSFLDEEDETTETFKLKKSNYSRRLAKQREKERKKKEETFKNEFAAKNGNPGESQNDSSKKPNSKSKEAWKVLSGYDDEDMDVESDEDNEKVNPFKNVLQSGVIPDAATIYAMKKHRQMARDMGDFIPVEEKDNDEDSKSRLARDDDNDRSDDEDDEPSRINFTIDTEAAERQKIRETFLSLQENSANELEIEDAVELERWEREQIKKGVGVAQVAPLEESQVSEGPFYSYSSSYVTNPGQHPRSAIQPSAELLLTKTVTLTTSDIKARLNERLHSLKTLHEAHKQEVRDCSRELLESLELIEKLKLEAPVRAQNYALYQSMSGYVQDLVECMDVKVAHIDLLEGKMMDLYKVRAQKLATRRQIDIRDQSDEYTSLSNELMKGVNVEFISEKNNQMDESKLRRAAEREGRRMRRRKQRERSNVGSALKHQDGLSSDDEEADIDKMQFKESRQNILNEAGTIFEDVVEEFGTLEGVMDSFENWKLKQSTSYAEAYVPMCLPKIFGVFVKLALLDWNPLEEERNFEESSWFHKLVQYGCFTDENEDPDVNLLPGVMERVVLAKITSYAQNVWNPLSQNETTKLLNLIKSLYDTYPSISGKSKQFISCLKAITTKISKAVDDEVFIPLYPKELLENRSIGASIFFHRQFWSAMKLLRNIISWDGIIAEQPLQQMALGSVLNRYILMGLHTSITLKETLDKCKTIVKSVPKNWVKGAKGGSTLPLLKQFSLFLAKLAHSYNSLSQKRAMTSEEAKEAIKEVVHLLVMIESLDDAVAISKQYSVSAFKNI